MIMDIIQLVDSNIKAIKEEFKDSNITMIFQPHRFSRTAQLFHEFIKERARCGNISNITSRIINL